MIDALIEAFILPIAQSELWLRLVPATVLIFASTQLFKWLAPLELLSPRVSDYVVRAFLVVTAYPLTRLTMIDSELTDWVIALPHAILACTVSLAIFKFAMPIFERKIPWLYSVLGGKQ